ncbi:MAG: polyprenyl diphosphate synthase [Acidiferrobacterales bacterium]
MPTRQKTVPQGKLQAPWWASRTVKGILYKLYERRLLADVSQRPLPQHLGLIQDGHRRYARTRQLSDLKEGYNLGAAKTKEVLHWCVGLGIKQITLWWLSTENLARDPDDVAAVLSVIEEKLDEWIQSGLTERLGIQIRPIGKLDLLPASAVEALKRAESATQTHSRIQLNVGVGYGGRQEIVDAVKGYLEDSFAQGHSAADILDGFSPDVVDNYLYTNGPDPDLIIRTSGELRLSGFMLWQSAFSEFYFCDVYWPEFRKIDFLRAIRSYQQRQRRFGK